MTKLNKLTILISSLALSCAAFAATSVNTMDITASVDGSCSVSSTGADFGAVVQFGGASSTGTIDVNCSSGLIYNVALDAGLQVQAGGTERSMASGADFIRYQLLKGSGTGGSGLEWGDTGFGNTFTQGNPVSSSGTGALQQFSFNLGVVSEGTNDYTPGANYSDTVTITVHF